MRLRECTPVGLLAILLIGQVNSQQMTSNKASQRVTDADQDSPLLLPVRNIMPRELQHDKGASQCKNTQNFTQLVPVVLIGNPLQVTASEKAAIADSFRSTYNSYTSTFCDPLFRIATGADLEIFPSGAALEEANGGDGDRRRRRRHLQPVSYLFNGEYTVTASQSNCDVVVPCDNSIFSSSFGRRRLGMSTSANPYRGGARGAVSATDEQRDLSWLNVVNSGNERDNGHMKDADDSIDQDQVNKANCICPAPSPPPRGKGIFIKVPNPAPRYKQPDLDKFEGNWYDEAIEELVDEGILENIESQTIGESLLCRCGQFPAKDPTFKLGQDGVYVIPSNQYPCRCEDQEEFLGLPPKDRRRTRGLKTGATGQGKGVCTRGKGKGSSQRSTFLCPPIPIVDPPSSDGDGH